MDVTENKKTPVSNLQEENDSLFNYLNSLSLLKTKECVEATLTLNSLGMDYFLHASPDVTIYEDPIVLMRNNILNTSKAKVSSEDINKIYTHEEALNYSNHACHNSLESSSQHTKIDLPQAIHDNPCSSEQRPLISSEEANWALELLGMQVPNITNVQDDSQKDSVKECGTYTRKVGQVEAIIEGADCDYNNLSSITQSMNLLPQSTTNINYKMQNVEHVASSSKHEIEDNPSEPIAATDRNQTRNNLANVALMDSNPIARGIDHELANIKRSITRSCLSYQPDITSLQMNNSVYTSNISSCTTKSDEMNAINEKPLLHRKNTSYSQMCVLPRNDIYLNEKMSSGRKPESPSCTSLHLSASQGHHLSTVPAPMERHLEPSENDDFTKSSVHIPGEDLCRSTPDLMSRLQFNDLTNKLLDENMKRTSKVHSKDSIGLVSSGSEHKMEEESADFYQNIPKKKRKVQLKRSDLTGEGGACRSCKCKKSRCLKNYCECFAAGVYCIGPCSCIDCSNKGDNEDTVLQARRKNDSKVVTNSNSSPQFGEDPNITLASKLQKRVCNCNKSGCQRKYCACFKDGVGCSPICKCQGCKNIYGRKNSTAETKSELEETEALQISRTLPPLSYSSMGKPPQISCSELFSSQNQELVESNATGSITIPDDVNCINTYSGKRLLSTQTPISGGQSREFSATFNPDNVTRTAKIGESATKGLTQSPVHIAMSCARKSESPSSTSSLLLSTSQGHRLSLVPASTERHLGPSEIKVQETKDFTQSSVQIPGVVSCSLTPTFDFNVHDTDDSTSSYIDFSVITSALLLQSTTQKLQM
ncbi:hypothetical protein TSUD_45860 [Trifolium subterraneum]|nr:hypothetical protein TSUD_45860 [Trifolium subterraneum]